MLNLNHFFDEFNDTYNAKVATNPFALINDEYIEMRNEKEYTHEHVKECVDVIYITGQQMRVMGFDIIINTSLSNTEEKLAEWLKSINNKHLTRVDMEQVITRAIGYMNTLGYSWLSALRAVHDSNMSKKIPLDDIKLQGEELAFAQHRYPHAHLVKRNDYYLLECQKTKKIIKPQCYSPAVITDKMIKPE